MHFVVSALRYVCIGWHHFIDEFSCPSGKENNEEIIDFQSSDLCYLSLMHYVIVRTKI